MKDLLHAAEEGRLNDVQYLLDGGRCKVDDEDEVCSVSLCVVCPCVCRIWGCVVGRVICIHMFHFSFVGCVIDIWFGYYVYFNQLINQTVNPSIIANGQFLLCKPLYLYTEP